MMTYHFEHDPETDDYLWFDCDPNAEPPDPEDDPAGQAWHTIDIWTQDDGSATVHEATNDDLDYGYPSEYAAWDATWPTVEAAQRHAGKSRVGISGVKVTVRLDGEEV